MWATILGWIIKSNSAKIAGGTLTGIGGLTALVFGLHTDIKTSTKAEIARAKYESKLYAKEQIEHFSNLTNEKLGNLKEGQDKIINTLHTLENRMWEDK